MATNKTARALKPTTTAAAPALADDTPTPSSEGEHAKDVPRVSLADGAQRTGRSATLADEVGEAVDGTVRVVQALLPDRAPAYLGAAALVVLGALDPPAVLVGGLAYEALRRWTPRPHPS